jgi:Rrf2 family transcriptional regulator, cysteine metabolism repressor
MKISTKFRYGLRAMVDLAQYEDGAPVMVKNISDRQGISKKYLDNLLASLKNADLLRSVRGAKGGYVLAKPADKITVEEIAIALEGRPSLVDCVADPESCLRRDICPTNDFWCEMSGVLENFMRNTTLAELARKSKDKVEKASLMYNI